MFSRAFALLLSCALAWAGLMAGGHPTWADLAHADPVQSITASVELPVKDLPLSAASEHLADAHEMLPELADACACARVMVEPAAPLRTAHVAPCLEGPQRPPSGTPVAA